MGAEYLLYGYGIVCLSMLVFNLLYSVYLRAGDTRQEKRVGRIEAVIQPQLQRLQAGQEIEAAHLADMRRRLSRVNNLLALDALLERRAAEAALADYCRRLQPCILSLAQVYQRRENTQAAYYCYFLSRHIPRDFPERAALERAAAAFMARDNFYCRVNAMKALCAFGGEAAIVEALERLPERAGAVLQNKVLVELLLVYSGDHAALIRLIWARFSRFTLTMQRALLDYIRFESGDWCEEMQSILADAGRNKELRFSAIRYFGRYPYEPAWPWLVQFVSDEDVRNWEYAAISASSLARYRGEDVVRALSRAMCSPVWYVRYNAAASLEAHGLRYEELMDVVDSGDRYAREMLMYRLERRALEKEALAEV